MTPNETMLYLLAGAYHALAAYWQSFQPAMAQYYEAISQNLLALLRAGGLPV